MSSGDPGRLSARSGTAASRPGTRSTPTAARVRGLFGTVHNEGASKGILVTTSGYGKASFDFAEGKPLELLDGSHLLYLLREEAGVEARIDPPEDWVDPEGAELKEGAAFSPE